MLHPDVDDHAPGYSHVWSAAHWSLESARRFDAADCENRVLVIRDATTADAAAIVAIGSVGFARTHEHLLGTPATRAVVDQTYTHEAVAESIARCNRADDAHFLVAERDGDVVGYLHYDCFADEPELHRIYLDQSEIGRGTGSRLMEELHARLGPEGSYIVMTALANETARRFYERHGLVEYRRIPDGNDFYRASMGVDFPKESPPVPAVVMRREPVRT